MTIRRLVPFVAAIAISMAATGVAPGVQPAGRTKPAEQAWVTRSNEHAQVLLKVLAKYSPEGAAQLGIPGLDDQVTQFPSDRREKYTADLKAAMQELQRRRTTESDPRVQQDLEILIKAADSQIQGQAMNEKYDIPYFNMPEMIFSGLRGLLDDRVAPERRKAALVRLRKYAGLEPGYQPITEQAKARTRDWRRSGQVGPARISVETNLARADFFINGIGELLTRYKIEGYEEAFGKLTRQLADYNAWVKQDILPLSRPDFRLPPDRYRFALEQIGVDIPPATLTAMAHKAFGEWQQEMGQIAREIAKARGLATTDYRDVIRTLKKEQLLGDAILPHYQSRLKDIEAIIRREKLVTLPSRPARIRLATPAETAQQPAPHMDPPQMLNNTGQQGEFVLPLQVPTAGSAATKSVDDFTFAAASWTLTAHEARPGHELQFDSMVEQGVSLARSLFAFNSVNVEGWGLYAEWFMKPYEPIEGQLISMQLRLMRAARAFIDPELQSGKLTPAEGLKILTDDVGLSEAFANTEIERYTFRSPGQATSYFYGYSKLIDLRREVEGRMGARFDVMAYHDFILSQGLLPPDLLRQAVLDRFVPAK